mgnify:CR=1 FL=1
MWLKRLLDRKCVSPCSRHQLLGGVTQSPLHEGCSYNNMVSLLIARDMFRNFSKEDDIEYRFTNGYLPIRTENDLTSIIPR